MFEPTSTWPNSFGQLVMWIGANNEQIWLPMGYTIDFEQCLNTSQFDLISLLVNFSFMWIEANNDQIWLPMGQTNESEQCSQPSPTWPNFALGKLFMWIGVNNDQTSDSEQSWNRLDE